MTSSPLPSLVCRLQPTFGDGVIEAGLERRVTNYVHAIRVDRGFYEASWWFPLDRDLGNTTSYLKEWFDNRLFCKIEEHVDVTTWEGVVWTMKLTLEGITAQLDMQRMWNAVRCDYTDTAGSSGSTSWYTNDASITRYGRREYIVDARDVSATEAASLAQRFLAEHASPVLEVVDINPNAPSGLEVSAVGLVVTANNKYVEQAASYLDNTTDDISNVVQDVIDNELEFLTAGNITSNTLQHTRTLDNPTRAYDYLVELTGFSDGSAFTPWLVYVGAGALIHYEEADPTTRYRWIDKERGLRDDLGSSNPWTFWPRPMRVLTLPTGEPVPGSFMDNRGDVWIEQIEMGQDWKQPSLTPGSGNMEELVRMQGQF